MNLPTHWSDKCQELINIGRYAAEHHWCPATGGNFSARLNDECAAISASGCDKGQLTVDDILMVDLNGQPLNTVRKPSAETLLHTTLYQLDPTINAVLHVHTIASTVLSQYSKQSMLILQNYEMLKPLHGITTHETILQIPIFANSQDMTVIAQELKNSWPSLSHRYAFLVRGHGCYCWGNSVAEAKQHLDALEFLFMCELEMLKLPK